MVDQNAIQKFFNDNFNQFSSETVRAYNLALSQFFSNCQKNIDEVKARDIRIWMASMTERGLKTRSVQLKLAALKSFYNYCVEENIINQNPTIKVKSPQKEDSLPYYLTKRQLALLQEFTINNFRERAIVETLFATGVRIEELLNIRVENIKWETKQIWIRKAKNNQERFVLFTNDCAERLKTHLKTRKVDSDYLFSNSKGRPLSQCLIQQRFREYSEALGFKVTPHTLRHTFATRLLEKGLEYEYIQELLGHSNINSTRIYTRLMTSDRKKQYDQYQQ
ncbi:site-specific tyrosine recombinase/integron integrase [Sporosarcina sp. FSL K6-1508]|uniref:site-specific tyrosine recombinase/integron integrase n=1 Tax=Sporosarcina sp. FSL K6-1508 TaxID=2921553 RepID=UPI0030F92DCC